MRHTVAWRIALFVCFLFPFASARDHAGNDPSQTGGFACVACDVVIRTIELDAQHNEQSIDTVVEGLCKKYFGGTWLETACDLLIDYYGDEIIQYMTNKYTPDQVCQEIRICGNRTCNLYPPNDVVSLPFQHPRNRIDPKKLFEAVLSKHMHSINPWDYIEEIINKVFGKHEPLIDVDGDLYSTIETFRGADWRGRDCDDGNNNIYPGRYTTDEYTQNPNIDHNCNGIYGVDKTTNKPWEELLCGDSQPRGVVVLGDSAAAHFSIPFPNPYLNQTSPTVFAHLAENEGDWPACSWSTAYWSTDQCPYSPLSSGVDSIYMRMLERNKCNHRDFQNIGVNGARSTSMNHTIMLSMARDQDNDLPLLVFYALVGNDVCNPHRGFAHMTSPSQFYEMVTSTLQYLDTKLPSGSHVFFVGLENGTLIWDTMKDQMHPLGVTYERLWEFVDCLGVNPCWGWLNPDPKARNYTEALANELNNQYSKIIANQKYKHFDMHYLGSIMQMTFHQWVNQGGNPVDLFEIVGGGHPSQLAQELQAAAIWNILEQQYPEAIGPINPNNDKIEQLFGNQGGY